MSWSCPRCGGGRGNCSCSHDTDLLEEIIELLKEIRDLLKPTNGGEDINKRSAE